MPTEDPGVGELKDRQFEQERAEREALAGADSSADAARHLRRADKAHYLRQKLEEAERADGQAATEGDGPAEQDGQAGGDR